MVAKRDARYLDLLIAAGAVMFILPVSDLDLERLARGSRASADPPLETPAPPEVRAAGANGDWWQAVTAELSRAEYAATVTSTGLQAPNRVHNLRTRFDELGIAVVPRTPKDGATAWRFSWQTTGFGRPGQIEEVSPSSPSAAGARVVYERDGWSEWYVNTTKGLEQGFTIDRRPGGEGPLQITGEVRGELEARARADGAVDFSDTHGACVIRYGELHVWDAQGDELRAKLILATSTLAIQVDDRGAIYPITVDPLLTSPSWTAESNQASAQFGVAVTTAGDVNGDGFSDVVIGAKFYDNGQADEGGAFVYHGSAAGLGTTPAWTAEGNQAGALFGWPVGPAGDVNGDGFWDVVIGAYAYDNGQTNEGRAFVYHGSASGLSSTPQWTAESDEAHAQFGFSVATAGDVNADGFADVIIGANQKDGIGQADVGVVFVYQGSASGLSSVFNRTLNPPNGRLGDNFGYSASTAGDVNGDGFSDVIVGAVGFDNGEADEGGAFLFYGSATGLPLAPAWVGEPDQVSTWYGGSVSTAGDVNGDGYSDVMVGAPLYSNGQSGEGMIFVYFGSATGFNFLWIVDGGQAGAGMGTAVAPAGDVNGDGYADVAIGVNGWDGGQTNEGQVRVLHGSATGFSSFWAAESNQAGALFGTSVGTAGDVNGDGLSDLIVGAIGFDNGQTDEGRAFVYLGSSAGLHQVPGWTTMGDQADAFIGFAAATAGDVNGDGYSDVIIGAPRYDNGQTDEGRAFVYLGTHRGLAATPAWSAEGNQASANFGIAAGTAGDLNGDGYSDVVIGAHAYDNGQTDEGRVFAYLGSATGLGATPAWTAESDQPGADFGLQVGTAGDVNGDGYSDILIGADLYDNGEAEEGRAYVYLGSSASPGTTPAWTAEGDQIAARFGSGAATAGDVNGDGFSDVVIGAFQYDNEQTDEGRAYVYLGSAVGLALTPAWTGECNQAGAGFGISSATAGDVNGDGFSDVVIGAFRYDNGQTDEGRAFLYYGSAGGVTATPAWAVESDRPGSEFGNPATTAGDVNGDGFADVLVAAPLYTSAQSAEGRVFVFHGGPGGPSATPSWSEESIHAGAQFGRGAGPAGDVNGDGYSDIVIGAPRFDSNHIDDGTAYIYFGNGALGSSGSDGLDRIAHQARTDDSAPIAILGTSNAESAFRLKVLGRTPAGRGRVRMQFEVKPFGTPFDATGLVTESASDTGTPGAAGSAVPISTLASGLAPNALYHWRLRIASDSPFFPFSPWLTHPGNGSTEADVRTKADVTAVGDGAPSPAAGLRLAAPTPNPFAAATRFSYTLSKAGRHRLAVYDVTGREVAVLAEGTQRGGSHVMQWNGRDHRGAEIPSGVYFLRLEFQGAVETQKIVITR